MLAFFACAAALLVGCAAKQPAATQEAAVPEAVGALDTTRFTPRPIALGAGAAPALWVLERGPLAQPLRYRVVVVPGSGCAGMGPYADSYFRGLLHAHVTVLHKPGVLPQHTTAPADCPAEFVQTDDLATWASQATAAVQQVLGAPLPMGAAGGPLPVLLVGISEGAELLPTLAAHAGPQLAGVVMLSGSGLDPREAGRLQAARTGHLGDWDELGQLQRSAMPDAAVVQGRSLRYWRALWRWPVQQPLIEGPWPLLQVWGDRDELVPPAAYEAFARIAQRRAAPYCKRSLPGADHGLQTAHTDGVQQVWNWLQQWARNPGGGLCAPVPSN